MTKDDIKVWLKSIKKDRIWLANVLGLSNKRAIDSWLSTVRPIPKQTERLISRLMSQYPVGSVITNDSTQSKGVTKRDPLTSQNENSLTLTVDSATFDLWDQASRAKGKLLREWATGVLTEEANKR